MKTNLISVIKGLMLLSIVTIVLLAFRTVINTVTISVTLLIVVLLTATRYGVTAGVLLSVLTMLVFNFFFIPPYHTFTVADPQNWVALIAFLLTSLVAGGLYAKEKSRTEEVRSLYEELQQAFRKAGQVDALKQSEQLKSALLDAVTHDLRTPLTSMKAAVTTMLSSERTGESPLDKEGQREMLEVINTEIDRMNHLIEGMIQMAKIESGGLRPQRNWSSLDEIVSNAITRSQGISTDHKIRTELENGLPLLRIDEKTISEVIYILIENATKFSSPGSEIVITAHKLGSLLIISVKDEGTGIPVHLRDQVFNRFTRFAPSTISNRPPGLGMGLSIARAIVEAHGGRIWVEDSKDGAKIAFSLPLAQSELAET